MSCILGTLGESSFQVLDAGNFPFFCHVVWWAVLLFCHAFVGELQSGGR